MNKLKLSPVLAATVAATVYNNPDQASAQGIITYTNATAINFTGPGTNIVAISPTIPDADKLLSISEGSLSGGEGASFTLSAQFAGGSTNRIYSGSWNLGQTFQLTSIPSESFPTGNITGLLFDVVNGFGGPSIQLNIPAGTVFTFGVSVPELTISRQTTNIMVSWPSNYTGYTLQFTTNLAPALWNTVTPTPVVTGSNYITTNSLTRTNRFYRLFQ